jgi:hypothetical protein
MGNRCAEARSIAMTMREAKICREIARAGNAAEGCVFGFHARQSAGPNKG